MSNPNIESEVQKCLKDLMHIRSRVIPVKVGKEVVASVRQNFRSGGFYGASWQRSKRQEVPFKGAAGSYGPLLSKTTHLMSSTDYVPGDAQVTIRNPVPYARYHNEGAESRVTKRMKKYFWARYYQAGGGSGSETKGKKGRKNKANPEAEFWKAMALKKSGSRIRIPRRRFLGPSPKEDKIVTDIINNENHIDMEHLLYDLIEHIGNNISDIRTIDEDYGQLEMLDDNRESYPLIFPAILIDSPDATWENIGGLNQKGCVQ